MGLRLSLRLRKSAIWCLSISYSPCMGVGSFPLFSAETDSESAALTGIHLSGGRGATVLTCFSTCFSSLMHRLET